MIFGCLLIQHFNSGSRPCNFSWLGRHHSIPACCLGWPRASMWMAALSEGWHERLHAERLKQWSWIQADLQHRNSWYCLAHHFAALAGTTGFNANVYLKESRCGFFQRLPLPKLPLTWLPKFVARQEWLTAANGFKNKGLTLVQPTIKAPKSPGLLLSLQLPCRQMNTKVTMPCTRQHMVVMQHCVLGYRSAQKPLESTFLRFWRITRS